MKKSKKLLSVILAAACASGISAVGASAEYDPGEVLRTSLEEYYGYTKTDGGYFTRGSLPDIGFIAYYLFLENRALFEDRCITTEENGFKKYVYEIPGGNLRRRSLRCSTKAVRRLTT